VDGRGLSMIHNLQRGARTGRLYGAWYTPPVVDTKNLSPEQNPAISRRGGSPLYSVLALKA